MSHIRNQLLCVGLSISCWEGRKQDRKATKEVADKHGTASSVGRYHKDLLPGAAEHEAILKIRNAWRVWHYENSLPWGDDSSRVMRSAAFFDYMEGYRDWKAQFEDACNTFYGAYDSLVARAEMHLNTLFDPTDYPVLEEVKRRFAVRMNVYPMPNADDFRVIDGIDPSEAEALRQQAISGLETQVSEALKDLWTRMHTVVTAMHSRLDIPHGAKGGQFRDSLVENIEDLLVRVPKLNLTNDPMINQLTDEMHQLICPPDVLRSNPDARVRKAAQAKALAARMAQYVGD